MKQDNFISCPECGVTIDVNEVLYHQLEEHIKKEYQKKSASREKEVNDEKERLRKEREQLNETVSAKVQQNLKIEKENLEQLVRNQIVNETSEQIQELRKELDQKSAQVRELNKVRAEVERLKREKDGLYDEIALAKEKEFGEKLNTEKQRIKTQAAEENLLKIKELEKKLEDQTKLAEEMKRKAEQGSIQLKGEVQELELERILKDAHVIDEITEVKKGHRGADVLHCVKSDLGVICGKIYYESKRTKNFDDNWLQKLRDDNLSIKADVLVLVTEAMPDGETRFLFRDGVWICSLQEVKALSLVLRHGILKVHMVTIHQNGKETKMELLYNYLTSQEFRGQFEAIIEGFKSLEDSYSEEKLKMQRIWKEREKQLEKILTNAVHFYGSLKGIAGASIPNIGLLEFPSAN